MLLTESNVSKTWSVFNQRAGDWQQLFESTHVSRCLHAPLHENRNRLFPKRRIHFL